MKEETVIIVGAGPSGLAMAACLSRLSIPHIVLEREDCFASLWKKYSYDRVHFHLRKQFCELPHMPFPSDFPPYLPKKLFTQYLDDYVSCFNIAPMYRRDVESARYDDGLEKWVVKARVVYGTTDSNIDGDHHEIEDYSGRFLVVASGETANPFVPEIKGLSGFCGDFLHSTKFKCGVEFKGKRVLVVGCGNSGMEISLDLANHGAKTSIIVRSPVHVLSRGMVYLALILLKRLPIGVVDSLMVMLSKLVYGDLKKYGLRRPTNEGPFLMKDKYGKYPVVDVGTCEKIKTGEIQVLSSEIESIKGNDVSLKNGKSHHFDAIVFCTGFKRSTHLWLKGDDYLLNDDGIPKPSYPNHWKGKGGLYCVGLSRQGFYGAKSDAENIANDIKSIIRVTPNIIKVNQQEKCSSYC
ncbi:Flavin-containing monooxygenase YUCCA10 [Morus notabilis]|uniref:Flavin-containing monooxygenase n=1 Tax=Morus notabilis TaxID=981085 RepID=W9SBQ6_9ROSA|nr:probable indole-3-pyruvate monooxygenase YUCCA10 [Morus notabilis]EXC34692.1 Flavin-containing monooxygenase YUCCA10 [Morus notabilis]